MNFHFLFKTHPVFHTINYMQFIDSTHWLAISINSLTGLEQWELDFRHLPKSSRDFSQERMKQLPLKKEEDQEGWCKKKEDIQRIKLQLGDTLNKHNKLHCLNPFLDENSVLRVGGRLCQAFLHHDIRHPAISCVNLACQTWSWAWTPSRERHGHEWITCQWNVDPRMWECSVLVSVWSVGDTEGLQTFNKWEICQRRDPSLFVPLHTVVLTLLHLSL